MTTKIRGAVSTTPSWFHNSEIMAPTKIGDPMIFVCGRGSLPVSPDAAFPPGQLERATSHLFFGLATALDIHAWLGTNLQPLYVETDFPNREDWQGTATLRQSTDVAQPHSRGLLGIVDMVEKMRESYPSDMWDGLPTDLAKNKKHYLYGLPKEED